ncbi:hypothetical protein [Bradyrhizobium jicamae]|uniref:hypothetical protein n=1 Tax=Bradyrhizobium jicamae TaxID=280332 RepID=UPI0012EE0253|nr:hypothetical protein [Bradyrhizobium jicamae]
MSAEIRQVSLQEELRSMCLDRFIDLYRRWRLSGTLRQQQQPSKGKSHVLRGKPARALSSSDNSPPACQVQRYYRPTHVRHIRETFDRHIESFLTQTGLVRQDDNLCTNWPLPALYKLDYRNGDLVAWGTPPDVQNERTRQH